MPGGGGGRNQLREEFKDYKERKEKKKREKKKRKKGREKGEKGEKREKRKEINKMGINEVKTSKKNVACGTHMKFTKGKRIRLKILGGKRY